LPFHPNVLIFRENNGTSEIINSPKIKINPTINHVLNITGGTFSEYIRANGKTIKNNVMEGVANPMNDSL